MRHIKKEYSGGDSREETPVPIPNTEVKLSDADGTARATVWESRCCRNLKWASSTYVEEAFLCVII